THGIEPETPSGTSEMQAETSDIAVPTPAEAELQAPVDPDSWRREVAERLNHYRARRRTREPRYPSLQLKFEPDPISSAAAAPMEPPPPPVFTARETVDYVHSAAAPRITLAEPVALPRIVPA